MMTMQTYPIRMMTTLCRAVEIGALLCHEATMSQCHDAIQNETKTNQAEWEHAELLSIPRAVHTNLEYFSCRAQHGIHFRMYWCMDSDDIDLW
mmetsp:Transcript_686/g.1930  ORF Transcript_686/g.1930 Transcript_686/m.1930 type:complete len:93 (+) Transcript_686:587-865(+)